MTPQTRAAAPYVAELCAASLARLAPLTRAAVGRIRREVPDYRSIDPTEHREHVARQLEGLLHGLAEGRRPAAADLTQARELGRVRALQGLRVEQVITAYHVGYQSLWTALLDRAQADGPGAGMALLASVDTIWTWVEMLSAAAADGYAATMDDEQAQRFATGHRLLESLYTGRAADEATAILARSIGFTPSAMFCAVSASAGDAQPDPRSDLERVARRLRAPAYVEVRAESVVLLVQSADTASLRAELQRGAIEVGISAARAGLEGLAQCLQDSDAALAFAQHTGETCVDFTARWWAITLHRHRDELAPLIAPPSARLGEHLADAVRAFADHGSSTTAAGAALGVHPNTVRYRLDRWRLLTGWDVGTADGLQRSLASLALAPWGTAE